MRVLGLVLALLSTPQPGDRVRVDTADLAIEGELLSRDEIGVRLKLAGGELVVPADEVTSIAVLAARTPPPPPPAKPPLPALRVPSAPTFAPRRGVWLTRWPMLFLADAGAGFGAERKTAIDGPGTSLSAGAGVSVEGAIPWLAFGGGLRLDRSRTQLVANGRSGCLVDDPATCFAFPDGLAHDVQAIGTGLYVKPYLMRGPLRVWVRAGGDAAFVEYAYASGSTSHGNGSATAFGVSGGTGIDWALGTRRSVLSASVISGTPLYEEDVDVFGQRWRSRGNPSSGRVRVSIGYAMPLGKTK